MKKTISQKTAKKIGLIYAISILIGSVVGVGIFLKNGSVFKQNNFNDIGILVSWIVAAVISLCTAWSFGEVGTCCNDHAGLAAWVRKIVHPKIGKFVTLIQPFFYYCIIAASIAIFASETFFQCFMDLKNLHMGAIFGFAAFLFLAFVTLNFLSLNVSKKLQLGLSFLKIVPILIVIVMGILYAIKSPSDSLFNPNNPIREGFSFTGVVMSLPAILFAFDSFIGVGNLSLEMKDPKKNVPLTIIIGMSLVVVIYLAISVTLMFTGTGSATEIFKEPIISQQAVKVLKPVFNVFLFVSIIGVLNAFSPVLIRSLASVIEDNVLYNGKAFDNFISQKIIRGKWELKSGYVLAIIGFLVFTIIIGIPSIVKNTDSIVDCFSNFPTTLFFGVYGIAILGGLINRKTKKVSVNKIFGFWVTAPIAIIGCFFVFGFQTFYTFSFQNITAANNVSVFGAFKNELSITNWEASVFYFVYLVMLFLFYFLNELLIKKSEKPKSPEYFILGKEKNKYEISEHEIDKINIDSSFIAEQDRRYYG